MIAVAGRAAAADVTLRGDRWSVAIDPATLAVSVKLADGSSLPISLPRPKPGVAANVRPEAAKVTWDLPAEHLGVTATLAGDALELTFVAAQPGEVTWPIVGRAGEAKPRAYALPLSEGSYVPADDAAWGKFLVDQSPMSTTAGLSMPFWGVDFGQHALAYVLTNPFNNELAFDVTGGRTGLSVTHAFTRNQTKKRFGARVVLTDARPVAAAKVYRRYLVETGAFVSMQDKVKHTPDAEKLLGAAHVYLWGDGIIARGDLTHLKPLAGRIVEQADSGKPTVGGRLLSLLDGENQKLLRAVAKKEFADNFDRGLVADALTKLLKRKDFYDPAAWAGVTLSPAGRQAGESLAKGASNADVARTNGELLHDAYADLLPPPAEWGDGFSTKMIAGFQEAGLDRLWLGSPAWDGLEFHQGAVKAAIDAGFLIGPYDSYHSIHSPSQKDTWETAQFDQALYDAGGIVKADGSKRTGFQSKGYLLSPAAARPVMERRVADLMGRFKCNSWFMDCDAFGDVFDDYSPAHPSTQASDAAERVSRMKWISEKFGAVLGSEGGSAYATGAIHFSHGIVTPGIGWGDPDVHKDKASKFYLGNYYPPDGPAVFFKKVPMKPEHWRLYADPRFRLPLYETVFHDSVVATHQWGFDSLKFDDPGRTRELTELLYGVPPLYHLNLAEWQKRKAEIAAHQAFFSPLHRRTGVLPMTEFAWVTDDRLVQRTRFGDEMEMVANFGDQAVMWDGAELPAHSMLAKDLKSAARTPFPAAASAGPVKK